MATLPSWKIAKLPKKLQMAYALMAEYQADCEKAADVSGDDASVQAEYLAEALLRDIKENFVDIVNHIENTK